jgi:SAM-dependent methyltransferase
MVEEEVPTPIDFQDMGQARAWVANTAVKRPCRPAFFAAFAAQLKEAARQLDVMEVGSGPGQLASHLLRTCPIRQYVALDFSAAMHEIARETVGDDPRLESVQRDFRDRDWADGLGTFDVVVTQQAAHEIRHRNRAQRLIVQMAGLLRPSGLLLYCDHYVDSGLGMNPDLYLRRDEQAQALKDAGLKDVRLVWDEGGIALHRAAAPD